MNHLVNSSRHNEIIRNKEIIFELEKLFYSGYLNMEKNIFFLKIFVFYKIYVICRKKCFYMEKKIIEKIINENVKRYISFQKYIFTQKMFVLQTKYKSFLNIYSSCKINFFDHRQSVVFLKLTLPKNINELLEKICESIYA